MAVDTSSLAGLWIRTDVDVGGILVSALWALIGHLGGYFPVRFLGSFLLSMFLPFLLLSRTINSIDDFCMHESLHLPMSFPLFARSYLLRIRFIGIINLNTQITLPTLQPGMRFLHVAFLFPFSVTVVFTCPRWNDLSLLS